jgi:NAD(P)H-dependent FMN reductase
MSHIAIISSSVRIGRNSHRLALYFEKYIRDNNLGSVEILDLHEYQFPVFDERLQYMKEPLPKAIEFSEKIKNADGVIIVTPEYNGGYPASLKNAIDLLLPEWKRKPVAIATASAGPFGGAQVNTSLAFSLWKIGVLLVPALYLVAKVQDSYQEDGTPADKPAADKRTAKYMEEFLWCMEASNKMK